MISGYFLILAIARLVIFCDKCAVRSLSTIIVILCAVRDTRLDRPLGKFLGAIALSQQLKRGLSRCKLNDRTLIELLSG
ncbi:MULTISPECIES: hypothetical protein [unclassified Microcoleus]|uniref:hypothetical protein n=1 Tax=unclassified Microcoleus TaxID=2642155 RepID=UPI002FD5B79B